MIDTCVCCGEYVPEGRMVCPLCVYKSEKKEAEQDRENRPHHLERPNRLRRLARRNGKRISGRKRAVAD